MDVVREVGKGSSLHGYSLLPDVGRRSASKVEHAMVHRVCENEMKLLCTVVPGR